MNSLMSDFEQAQLAVLRSPREWLISGESLYCSYLAILDEISSLQELQSKELSIDSKEFQRQLNDKCLKDTGYLVVRLIGLNKNADMLIGFAIENLLKGILVHFNKHFIEIKYDKDQHNGTIKGFKGSRFNWPGNGGHDLCAIAEKLSEIDSELLKLNQQDLITLHRLTGSITWAGRYPSDLVKKNGGLSHHGPVRHDVINLYERCYLVLMSLIQA